MTENTTNTIPATGGSLSRTLTVERSVYGEEIAFLGTRSDLDGRQIGAHLIRSEVREVIAALEPYAVFHPATVKDLDGDYWIEREEDGLFSMVDAHNSRTLDEIAESYGIDDGVIRERDGLALGDTVAHSGLGLDRSTGTIEEFLVPGTIGGDVLVAWETGSIAGSTLRAWSGSLEKVEPEPEPETFERGEVVLVREHYTHFLVDGSRAEVVEGGPFTYTVKALEPLKDGRDAGTTQYVDAGVLSKIEPEPEEEPLAEWERELLSMAEPIVPATPPIRFLTGIDPSVREWGEIMKPSAIMTIPEPVEIGTLAAEPEDVVPTLTVGDRVQVIDATGHGDARLSDEADVIAVRGTLIAPNPARGPIVEVRTDDGRVYGMFAKRFERVIREEWEPQVGDRVALVEEKGDGSSSAKVGDLGRVTSIQEDDGLDGPLLFVVMDDGHTTTRFRSRWEKSDAPIPCDLCGAECVTGSPVRMDPTTGYYVPARG